MGVQYPFISAMLVTYNEEEYIEQSLKSLINQTYPSDRYEIIIIDGGSTDKTNDIINSIISEHIASSDEKHVAPIKISLYENPKKILAAGWNIGIRKAEGEYVIRIDAHAYATENFIEESVKTMLDVGDAVCVGGSMETISDSDMGELIKEALSSPFGVGGSKFRYKKEPGYVDTVAYGLYRKSIFEEVGYFDEQLVRTQDNDLHRKIRSMGGKFYLNPAIKSFYYSRNSIKKLSRQQFLNGKWTMINFLHRPGKMAIRHFIPFGFVVALCTCLIASLFLNPARFALAALLLSHLLCGLYFALKRTNKLGHAIKLPWLFILIHLCYGCGSFAGIFHKRIK